jgi:hypothetical protein
MTVLGSHIRGRPATTHSVIARSKATKQSSFAVHKLDCFAALGMTAAVRKGDRVTAVGA